MSIQRVSAEGRSEPQTVCIASLRMGGAFTLAAAREVSEMVLQREGRWKPDTHRTFEVKNAEDSRRVSRILGDEAKGLTRQPGGGTVGSRKK